MEEFNTETEKETEVATITRKAKVLAIGGEECSTKKPPSFKYNANNFQEDFRKHLCLLLTGSRKTIEVVEDWDLVERFTAASIKEDNQPRRYHFSCQKGNSYPRGTFISGPTFNPMEVMALLRKRLKEEKWISKNVIETPLKTKIVGKKYYGSDQYIQEVVSEALDVEMMRIFKFVQYLQYSHRESNRK
ncbi:uncharacterized protein LOC115769348 [Drosophila novamexicana]|uniref:uncharacterized protein LOC115769348 n=1 Tax=Drosophila novamexicana TaxID=47314 RepID=UPI0011E5D3CF|nr:uncharacterized protein LOC115769348 [Drosophila novamexicana]